MPKTNLQTVEVFFPWSTKIHYMMMTRPIIPAALAEYDDSVGVMNGDTATVWWWNGSTCVYEKDGTMYRFWNKPTIADAVATSSLLGFEGGSYRFHSSGVVEQVYQGKNYYWSADMEAVEAKGEPMYPEGYCDTAWFNIFGVCYPFEPSEWSPMTRNCRCYDCKESAGVFDSERAPTRF